MLEQFLYNVSHNLFKPLLLFFYLGFLFPCSACPVRVPVSDLPGLTIYLLIAIGWHGGEESARSQSRPLRVDRRGSWSSASDQHVIGILAYIILCACRRGCGGSTRRRSPAITARTRREPSSTCLGVLTAATSPSTPTCRSCWP